MENNLNIRALTGNDAWTESEEKELPNHTIGAKSLQIFASPNEPDSKFYKELKIILKEYLKPKPSEIADQYEFSKRIQKEGQISLQISEIL